MEIEPFRVVSEFFLDLGQVRHLGEEVVEISKFAGQVLDSFLLVDEEVGRAFIAQ
jgi:hypothetical protein